MLSSANNFFRHFFFLFSRSLIQLENIYGCWTWNIFHSFPLGSTFFFSCVCMFVLFTSFFFLVFGIFLFTLEQCTFESRDRYNSLQHFKLIVKLSSFDIKTSVRVSFFYHHNGNIPILFSLFRHNSFFNDNSMGNSSCDCFCWIEKKGRFFLNIFFEENYRFYD